METNISKILTSRNKYLDHLAEDLLKNDIALTECFKEKEELENLVEHVKTLSVYPEKESLIPLTKNLFMKGKIVHTGEYHVKHRAFPDSYVVLQTSDQTLKSLETKIETKGTEISNIKYARLQLEERLKILKGENHLECGEDHTEAAEKLPDEIKSEKGSAFRVGEFYEIVEFD